MTTETEAASAEQDLATVHYRSVSKGVWCGADYRATQRGDGTLMQIKSKD